MTEAILLIDGVMDQIHELAFQLRPKMLDELGSWESGKGNPVEGPFQYPIEVWKGNTAFD